MTPNDPSASLAAGRAVAEADVRQRYDEGFVRVAPGVWVGKGEVVAVGTPSDDDDHDCDAMGCGMWHVLWRARLAVARAAQATPNDTPAAGRAVAEADGLIERAYDDALDARDDRSHYPRWRNVNYLTKRDYRAFAIRLLDLRAAQATPAEGAAATLADELETFGRAFETKPDGGAVWWRAAAFLRAQATPPAPTDGADVGEAELFTDTELKELGSTRTPGTLLYEAGCAATRVREHPRRLNRDDAEKWGTLAWRLAWIVAKAMDRATRPHPSAPSDGSASAPSETDPNA